MRWPWGWLASVVVMGGLGAYHWLIYTPRPDIPHRLVLLDMLFRVGVAGAIVVLGLLIGLRVLRPLRMAASLGQIETLALGAGLGLGAISLLTLALGVLHLYYTATFVALLAVGPLLFPTERGWVSGLVGQQWKTARTIARRRAMSFEALVCLPLGVISLSGLLLCYMRDFVLPEGQAGYDTYQYHWAIPSLLLRSHAWQAFPGWAHANLPFNTEMLDLIPISLRAPTAANILQDTFLVLFAMLLFSLLRRHFGRVVAWLAVASLVSIPLLVAYSSQSYVETALLFYGFAALSLVILWQERRLGTSRAGLETVALAGVCLGFAVASKYTALELAPGLLLLLGCGCLSLLRKDGGRPLRARLRGIAFLALTFVAGLGLVMAPWLLKDWFYLGNPVYPALGSVFADPLWNAARDQTLASTFAHFGPRAGVVARLHLYGLDLFVHPGRYREAATYPTGDIAWAAALAIPSLLIGLWRGWFSRDDKRRGQTLVIAGLTAVAFLGLAAWSASGALVERYALPNVVLTTALGATLVGWLAMSLIEQASKRNTRRLLRPAQIISLVALISVMVVTVKAEELYLFKNMQLARNPLPLVTGSLSENQILDERLGGGQAGGFRQMVDYVNTQLPHDGKLLMLARGTGYFFSDRAYVADSGGDWVPYLVSAGKTPQGILDLLHAQGYTYVIYDAGLMRWLEYNYQNQVLLNDAPTYLAFQQAYLIPVASWGDFALYRVP